MRFATLARRRWSLRDIHARGLSTSQRRGPVQLIDPIHLIPVDVGWMPVTRTLATLPGLGITECLTVFPHWGKTAHVTSRDVA